MVGIDLGTTNSLVAVASWPESLSLPRVMGDEQGEGLVPSVVVMEPGVIVGRAAMGHPNAIASSKRLMGKSASQVRGRPGGGRILSYEVVGAEGDEAGPARIAVAGASRLIAPEEVAAAILRELRQRATRDLGVSIERAVITVPAYFDDAQRQATRTAAGMAGFTEVKLLAEPTAAALAYGLGAKTQEPMLVAVYDLGGGTFDLSILRLTPGDEQLREAEAFEVLATAGDTQLGGDDFDAAVVMHIVSQSVKHNPALQAPSMETMRVLKRAAEEAKIALSSSDLVAIDLMRVAGEIGADPASIAGYAPLHLSRQAFEALINPLIRRTLAICDRAISDAKAMMDTASGEKLASVILVGGSTRVPAVRRAVAAHFGLEPYTGIDPDRAIALGAAVQAAVLDGRYGGAMLLDVVPLSLGIETANGAFAKIIMRNAPIPTSGHEMFSTQIDGQRSIKIHVLQGEREMSKDCRSLGVFHLKDIPPMPAGIPQLRVEFRLDGNGILSVHAREARSGKILTTQVVPSHGLSEAEIQRLDAEALHHARADMLRHRIADLAANSTLDVTWIKRQLGKHAAAMEPAARESLESALATLEGFLAAAKRGDESIDADAFAKAKEHMDRLSMPLHELAIKASLASE